PPSPIPPAQVEDLRLASGWSPHSRRKTAWCWSDDPSASYQGRDVMSRHSIFARPARLAAVVPYLWLVAFFLVPFGFVLKISLSQTAIAQPPYLPVFELSAGWEAFKAALAELSFENYALLISDNLYLLSYLRSVMVACIATAILLLLGYPISYAM